MMKIKGIALKDFKRFTDLKIDEIPESAKLVLIVGPNGSGKSSLFDAFMHWHRGRAGWGIDHDKVYYQKGNTEDFRWDKTVSIENHENRENRRNSFYFRTAYRNDPDFNLSSLSRLGPPSEELRIYRSIENDQAVSQNYQRLVYDTVSGVYDTNNDDKSVAELRNELIGGIRTSMKTVFGDLVLRDISDPLGGGSFFFEKGNVKEYHYKNLSGGEKAAFDLLLDLHIKRKFFADAIWCIDEIETHLHTKVQGALLREMFALVPDTSQLWLTTHSLGVMRAAYALSIEDPGSVAIIDFDGFDPDTPAHLKPSNIGRVTWEKMLSIALDDLSDRIIPPIIVVCEGSSVGTRRRSFDAEIYNRILGSSVPEVVFVSGGSSSEIGNSSSVIRAALKDVTGNSHIVALCDRDDKSETEVLEFESAGGIVLPERNLESYLFADDVLEKLAVSQGLPESAPAVLDIKKHALAASALRGNRPDDLKSAAGEIFVEVRRLLGLTRTGNDKDAFMRDTLAPLIEAGMTTYDSLTQGILARLPIRN